MIGFNQFYDQFEDPNHKDFSYAAKKLLYRYFCYEGLDRKIDAIQLRTNYH